MILPSEYYGRNFAKQGPPRMMIDLQSSGSKSVDGNWRALGKLLLYCSGCKKGCLINSIQIPGHFVYRTRFSRTSGKSFLLPQCRTDVLYVSDPCEHLDQGEEGNVGFFCGVSKPFSMSKVRKMLIKKRGSASSNRSMSLLQLQVVEYASRQNDSTECQLQVGCIRGLHYVCLNGHLLGICTLLPLSDSEEASETE